MSTTANKKRRLNQWGDDHPEKLNENVPTTVGWNQQLKSLVNPASMLDQMFGSGSYEAPHKPTPEHKVQRQEHLLFSRAKQEQDRSLQQETSFVLSELKKQVTRLEQKGGGLVREISKIKVEQMPPKTGIYYLRYLEWLITLVKQLSAKIDEGQAWLQTFNQRSKKKMGYWKKYKKHGTSFGLSNERSLATQTG